MRFRLALVLSSMALAVVALAASDPTLLNAIRGGVFGTPVVLPNPFKLLVWNIDRDTERDAVRDSIDALHPDVCLLQEVDLYTKRTGGRDVAADLARDLSMSYAFGTAFEELNQGDSEKPAYQGQAMLSRAEIVSSRAIHFKTQTGFWKPNPLLPSWFPQRRLGGRIALVSRIRLGEQEIVFYNLHLESRGLGVTRYDQLKEVLADADATAKSNPVLLAGDLNTKYTPGKFGALLKAHGFGNCFGKEVPRTHRVIGALDWILVRGNLMCEEATVDKNSPGSDHFPLTALIRLR